MNNLKIIGINSQHSVLFSLAKTLTLITLLFSFPLAQQFTEVAQELGVEDTTLNWTFGVHWVQADDDNQLDLYVSNVSYLISPYRPLLNRLFINHFSDSSGFVDEAVDRGAEVEHGNSPAAGWADYNLDGLMDFYVANSPAPVVSVPEFYRNDGTVFTEIGAELGVDIFQYNYRGIAWGDYNNDGRPDMYVTSSQFDNYLLRNDGDRFTDMADELNIQSIEDLVTNNPAVWGDYDNDGDLDLYLIVSIYPNKLFRNDLAELGRFSEVGMEAGVADSGVGRIATWVDYDNDGDLDLFMIKTHHSSMPDLYRLYQNEGGLFTDVAGEVGIADSVQGTYVSWADYDNDGDQDAFITNIYTGDKLYRNDINVAGVFTEIGAELGMDHDGMNLACAWGDYDNDGDMDLYVGNTRDYQVPENGLNLLYRNNQDDNNYLKVRFLSANGSMSRHGSRIWVYYADTDSLAGMRDIDAGSGGISQNMYDAHFGLDGTQAYDIVIRSTVRVNGENLIIDKTIIPEMGGVVPIDIGGFIEVRDLVDFYLDVNNDNPMIPQTITLKQNYPNPFNSTTAIPFSISRRSDVQVLIYNIQGQLIHRIERKSLQPGEHEITWDGRNREGKKISSGIYLYRLTTAHDQKNLPIQTKKMLILK